MTSRNRKEQQRKIALLLEADKLDEALGLLLDLEASRGLDASELIHKGRTLQLTSSDELPLELASQAFRDAAALDPENPIPLTELGWFYYAVEDDSKRALPFFEQAIALCQRNLTEATKGYAKVLEELESTERAATALRAIQMGALIEEELDPEQAEWLRPESKGKQGTPTAK